MSKKIVSNFKIGDKVYVNDQYHVKNKIYTLKEDYINKWPNGGYKIGEWFLVEGNNVGVRYDELTLYEPVKEEPIKKLEKTDWGF